MQGMRQVDRLISAISRVASAPSSRAGYEEMLKCYVESGMGEEADSVSFLISEKFRADSSNSDPEQRRDDTGLS
jgi:hypothetical protein